MDAQQIWSLQCVLCGRSYPSPSRGGSDLYTCPTCGSLGVLEVQYDYEQVSAYRRKQQAALQQEVSLWRYRPYLPISYNYERAELPPLAVGWTPLYPVQRLRERLGLPNLWLKDDTRNPSGSLKDRASVIAATLANGRTVACASTGNAASSLAVQAASMGLRCYIFVPENAPRAKVVQLLMCGATVFAVQGSYDQAFDLCIEACNAYGWYNRNTGYNPYLVEGKKTVGLEIAEQLGWRTPDMIIVPTGDGCIISGVYRGFADLVAVGVLKSVPRLVAVQAEGASALVQALKGDGRIREAPAQTLADGISVGLPRNGALAVRQIRASGGFGVTVSDPEILAAEKELASLTGVFAEPSAAASYAGLLRLLAEGRIASSEQIVLLVTGSGLKSIDAVAESAGSMHPLKLGADALATVAQVVSRAR